MKNLKGILAGILLFTSLMSWSQKATDIANEKSEFWENVRFGGGIQLSIGNGYTTIGVSPSAIYEISDKFATGVGVSYLYSRYKLQDLTYNVYGVSALALYNPIKEIQLSIEFEELSVNQKIGEDTSSYWLPALYIGAAYSMGRRAAIGMRYDVLYDEQKSIYDSAFTPFIRVYF